MRRLPVTPLSLKGVKTYSLKDRPSKVDIKDFARPFTAGGSFADFLASLPDILAAGDFKAVVRAMTSARQQGKTLHWAMGAHVIKVGLNPLLIRLMEEGFVSALSLNGAGIVHDTELAMVGRTSEDVEKELGTGTFGMARETAGFLNRAIKKGQKRDGGWGPPWGKPSWPHLFPLRGRA